MRFEHHFWCATCKLYTYDVVKASNHEYTHPMMRKIGMITYAS